MQNPFTFITPFDRNMPRFEGWIRFYEVQKISIKKKHMSRNNRQESKGSVRKLEVREINLRYVRESVLDQHFFKPLYM